MSSIDEDEIDEDIQSGAAMDMSREPVKLAPQYCLGFVYNEGGEKVWLQQKRRTWQAGKLNGIGGEIDRTVDRGSSNQEVAIQAMHREFNEEVDTGLGFKRLFWRNGPLLMFDNNVQVYTFFVRIPNTFFERLHHKTDEELVSYYTAELPPVRLLVPHVAWLVQLGFECYHPEQSHLYRVDASLLSSLTLVGSYDQRDSAI